MINVKIEPEREAFVQQRVASGQFASAEDLVNEAVRLMEERQRSIASLRAEIQAGVDSLEQGHWVDGQTFMDELLRDLAEPSGSRLPLESI